MIEPLVPSGLAPLAQLRVVDEPAWHDLYGLAARTMDMTPGNSALVQATAAALLGHPDLARSILRDGEPRRPFWPDLTPPTTKENA